MDTTTLLRARLLAEERTRARWLLAVLAGCGLFWGAVAFAIWRML